MSCKHEWKVLSETTTKSKAEALRECGVTSATNIYGLVDRKHIQLVACEKCGKLKKFVESI